MKILFLALDVDLGTNRGESVHTRNLAASMVRAGHEVRLVVGANRERAEVPELDVSVRPDRGDLSVLLHVQKVARRFRPDVVYERRFSPKVGAAVGLLSRRPFVLECNGIAEEEAAMQDRPIMMTRVRRFKAQIRLRLLRRAAAVVAVTPGLRDIMVRRYGVSLTKAFVVPNGVDPTLFLPMNKGEARAALGLPSRPLVCYVGNLVRWQGLAGLLDAIRAARTPLDLVIVGDGPDSERLRLNADQLEILHRVHFAGEVRHELVPRYIAAADACVAPFSSLRNSASGVSALKVLEYLACARPVVVSAVPGAGELVETYGCGIVVPPEDTEALARALERVMEDTSLARAAMLASATVRDRNSWDRTAEAVLKVLADVVGGRAPTMAILPAEVDPGLHA